ncbi:ATP-binding cassette sub-family A member 3 [Aplysia californica]|uniref:ATP-binding cassette sub-family A member 3 n=1 Tax=Aplysia californica TaxID=6500 RepID=A0ABM1AB17_APLCA|nr:ATP-binding cassette sub-family A member 3 [Aplysia californica]
MSLNMYEDQITVLLGHNGAGKTTTMSMLTGFIAPNSGTAVVNGYDIRSNIDEVRETLGLCPQHDILFDLLTVREHLYFFAKMKGVSGNLDALIATVVNDMSLTGKENTQARHLSGGQKRKLSVGIALIGGSKVVILDEPSSGMDPGARRHIWDVLQRNKRGRTVLLTTHYMDEADALGDRIAIMAEGVVKCCGTSMFLKKLYGAGYHLIIVKGDGCRVEEITQIVRSTVPGSDYEEEIGSEISFSLPDEQSALFSTLFTELESRRDWLGISGFGTKATTMEEVFLRVGDSAASGHTFQKPDVAGLNPAYENGSDNAETNGNAAVQSQLVAQGGGYRLIIVKGDGCKVEEITQIVRSIVPGSDYEGEIGSEIRYSLPDDQNALFSTLFTELESRRDELGISGYGNKATTMEEVFLRVGYNAAPGPIFQKPDEGAQNPAYQNGSGNAQTDVKAGVQSRLVAQGELDFNVGYTRKTGIPLLLSQFRGEFVKKMLYSWRSKLLFFLQLLVPLGLTAGGMAILNMNTGSRDYQEVGDQGTVAYDLSPFDHPIVPYTDGSPASSISSDLADKYAEIFSTHPGTVEKINRDKSSNVSEYLLQKMNDVGFDVFSQRFPIGAEFLPQSNNSIKGVALYNDRVWHAKPVAVVQMLNAFIREYIGDGYSIQASLHPMPERIRANDPYSPVEFRLKNLYPLTIFISLGMAFLLSSFVYTLIVERQRGCKHLQEVSGVNPFMYWLATFLWDYIIYLAVVIGIIAIFLGFNETAFIGEESFGPLIVMFLLFGFAACFSSYVFQFVFKSPPTGFVVTLILYFILSLFTGFMLMLIKNDSREDFRILFSLLFLPFNLNKFITESYGWHSESPSIIGFVSAHKKPGQSVWDFDSPSVGLYVFMMAVQAGVAVLLLMLIEFHVLQKIGYLFEKSGEGNKQAPLQQINMTPLYAEDSDVTQERERLFHSTLQQLFTTDSLILMELSKNFGQMTAVDHLCVGVPEQECFGLLGQNGAGKTTTFKMLTGQEMVSGGNAYVKTYDIKDNIKKVQSNMGYCPQFDALTNQLTGRETLTLYCRIKGIPEEEIPRVCDSLIDSLMLTPHADKLVGQYSGGNKRKLSTALALVGDPAFIMLDEPSSGMDPAARRHLWTLLSRVRASGRTLVLTSHSMEECDALCTRIAIMVNGRFMCLGSPQHLKNKFGHGYTLIAQMELLEDGSHADHGPVVQYIQQNVPSATVFDDHQGYAHIQIPDMSVSLAEVFSLMENSKKTMHVRDYSVHQTTLEQVFLGFARFQKLTPEPQKKCCFCC